MVDATSAPQEALEEAALGFFDGPVSRFGFEKCSGGVNNRLYYVTVDREKRFVLRIYNNGGFTARVAYEHDILLKLYDLWPKMEPAAFFTIPRLLPTRKDSSSFSWRLNSMPGPGITEACCFELIEGAPAKNTLVIAKSCGRATAVLLKAMEKIHLSTPCPNPRFKDILEACPGVKMSMNQLESILDGPEFDSVRDDTKYLLSELKRVIAVAETQEGVLLKQQIHADLHTDNFLATDKVVTGVLDFEFSAHDWRVMEAAVGLTKYLVEPNAMELISEWIDGYLEDGGVFQEAETLFLSDGMVLRILSNVVFFAGRSKVCQPPQDRIETLVSKILPYAKRCRWIEANRDHLVALIEKKQT